MCGGRGAELGHRGRTFRAETLESKDLEEVFFWGGGREGNGEQGIELITKRTGTGTLCVALVMCLE